MTNAQFIADLETFAGYVNGRSAVSDHLAKVRAMSDAELTAHRAQLHAMCNTPVVKKAAKRMVREIIRKHS